MPAVALGIIMVAGLGAPTVARATGSNVAPSTHARSAPTATPTDNQQQGDPTQTSTVAPTTTPTPTVGVRATATRTPTNTPSSRGAAPGVVINANLYGALDPTRLRRGDTFKAQAVRFAAAETPLPRDTFLRAVSNLATIPTSDVQRYGLVKEIVLSSVQDLQTYVTDPAFADITAVEYDFEGGMTPLVEYSNPVGSAAQFAQIAHAHGKIVSFTPIASMLNHLISSGGMAQIGPYVDEVGYQGQKHYLSLGEAAFLSTIQSNSAAIHRAGSHLRVQIGFGWEDCPTTVHLFTAAAAWVDYAAIGTHSDSTFAACVLSGLRP